MEESMRSLRLIAGNAHRPKMKPELRLGTCVQKRSKHTGDARSSGSFFVDYAERGGKRRSQTMFNRILGVFYKLVNYILFKGCLPGFALLCRDSG